jgi:Solute carrier family 35
MEGTASRDDVEPIEGFDKAIFSRLENNLIFVILLGQVISVLGALANVSTELLFVNYEIEIPELQTFFTYILLMVVCIPCTIFYQFKGEFEDCQIIDFDYLPWYILAAFLDFEASYWVIYSFQFIGMLNVTLILCLTTPFVLLLTIIKTRNPRLYRPLHYVGVLMALTGVIVLVFVPEARAKLANLGIWSIVFLLYYI